MKVLSLLLSIFSVIMVLMLLQRMPDKQRPVADEEEHEAVEVAGVMGNIQRFHQKFWLATRAGNAELAGFYLHEMEEYMEDIAAAGVVDDGVDVSANMRTYGLATVEHLEGLLKQQGVQAMAAEADLLVTSCNTCHERSGYPQIKIRVPVDFQVPDQDLSP